MCVFVFISFNLTCTVSLMSLVCVCEILSNISDDSDVKEKRVCCIDTGRGATVWVSFIAYLREGGSPVHL